jgi:hypothetical protein
MKNKKNLSKAGKFRFLLFKIRKTAKFFKISSNLIYPFLTNMQKVQIRLQIQNPENLNFPDSRMNNSVAIILTVMTKAVILHFMKNPDLSPILMKMPFKALPSTIQIIWNRILIYWTYAQVGFLICHQKYIMVK